MNESPVRVIVGPTAVGKSEIAMEIAASHGFEIVAVDSRLVYRGLDIGTAKPRAEARTRVPHHMIDLVSPGETYDAMRYAADARAAIAAIRARGREPLVEGGTGFYLQALLGPDLDGPGPDHGFRRELLERAAVRGAGWLHEELLRVDPVGAARLHPRDTSRLVRALEIARGAGRPASELRRGTHERPRSLDARIVVMTRPRHELNRRIAERWEMMVRDGLVQEVRGLLDLGYSPEHTSLRTPGYREVIAHLSGKLTWVEAGERAVSATRRYAKRQLTWFRHQVPDASWIDVSPEGRGEVVERVLAALEIAPLHGEMAS